MKNVVVAFSILLLCASLSFGQTVNTISEKPIPPLGAPPVALNPFPPGLKGVWVLDAGASTTIESIAFFSSMYYNKDQTDGRHFSRTGFVDVKGDELTLYPVKSEKFDSDENFLGWVTPSDTTPVKYKFKLSRDSLVLTDTRFNSTGAYNRMPEH
jgi:hypothetical protein